MVHSVISVTYGHAKAHCCAVVPATFLYEVQMGDVAPPILVPPIS